MMLRYGDPDPRRERTIKSLFTAGDKEEEGMGQSLFDNFWEQNNTHTEPDDIDSFICWP